MSGGAWKDTDSGEIRNVACLCSELTVTFLLFHVELLEAFKPQLYCQETYDIQLPPELSTTTQTYLKIKKHFSHQIVEVKYRYKYVLFFSL